MNESTVTLISVGAIIGGLIILGSMAFTRLRSADAETQRALGGIDLQLARCADLIPTLVTTVKSYATHERTAFDEVTTARVDATKATQSSSVEQRAAADAALHSALTAVLAVAARYPALTASSSFLTLQRELTDTETTLTLARQVYNDRVGQLNALVQTIPWLFFSGFAGVRRRALYEAPPTAS